jgi:hypothetical protein
MKIPEGATVMRLCKQPDGSIELEFGRGDPLDYIWTTWEKSSWKSIAWLQGKAPNDPFTKAEGQKMPDLLDRSIALANGQLETMGCRDFDVSS